MSRFWYSKKEALAENSAIRIKCLQDANIKLRLDTIRLESANESRVAVIDNLRKIIRGQEKEIAGLIQDADEAKQEILNLENLLDDTKPQCCECIDAVTRLSEENAVLKSKLTRAQKWYYESQKQTPVLTCAYCGEKYPKGTPVIRGVALRIHKHIMTCKDHPMKRLLDFVKWIDDSITDTCNDGHVWRNVTPIEIKNKCRELLS